jgi:hypothetical protein
MPSVEIFDVSGIAVSANTWYLLAVHLNYIMMNDLEENFLHIRFS